MIDLRSDTITRPSSQMRRVMAEAVVGDDVLGDDPTVQALEKRTAEILGKEAAVYMPSGTMTNQVAVRTHTEPGDEIVLDAGAHIYYYEAGAPAALSGVMCRMIDTKRGIFTAADLRAVLRPSNIHHPRTKLVCLENTHNRGGGSVWSLEQVGQVAAVAHEARLRMHLDGARLWNACVATGVSEASYASHFDSVSVCFSKGLGAPIGSVLAGSAEFIERARRFRKMFGGGMRQAGIIAAGAIYALDHNRHRLAEDHANARTLAEGIWRIKGISLDVGTVETNIVVARVTTMSGVKLSERLQNAGVRVMATGPDTVRAVTSLEVSARDIAQAVEAFERAMA